VTNNNDENDNSSQSDGSDVGKEDSSAAQTDLVEKLQSDILYLKADFENYKKRMIKERSDIMKYGCENLVVSFLNVLDNFERAMAMEITPENIQSFSDGIHMISTEFKNVLARFGVSEVKALGENFDPSHHEAMGTEPTNEFKPGTVSKVFTKPYKLHDRLIRPGKVVIAQELKKETDGDSTN
jgi:molecular chaperone GrpE